MNDSMVGKRRSSVRSSHSRSMIESLEDRRLLSAAPVQLKAATPAKILAGNTGTDVVTIRNLTAASETEAVTITLAPSLDGTTAAGAYSSPSVSETLTLKAHGSASVKVPFVPPTTLAAGKYHTLATVEVGTNTFTATAPGAYTLTLPPGPTTTPSLIGHYSGLITATSGSSGGIFGGGTHTTHEATFIWQTTAQTDSSLTGLFAVGSQQTTGTMTGSENTSGVISYTLASADINYTILGKVTSNGSEITGTFKGSLVNNIFAKLNGHFKILLQSS
jgi:hypothetical protein